MVILPASEGVHKPGRRVCCPRCEGVGRQGKGMQRRPCRDCGGTGKVTTGGEGLWDVDVLTALFGAEEARRPC